MLHLLTSTLTSALTLTSFSPIEETGEERKPEFLVQPASVTKVVGASVLLPCVVTGFPAPNVRWMLGDKLLLERYEHAL